MIALGVRSNTAHIKSQTRAAHCWDRVLDDAVLHTPRTAAAHAALVQEAIKCTVYLP